MKSIKTSLKLSAISVLLCFSGWGALNITVNQFAKSASIDPVITSYNEVSVGLATHIWNQYGSGLQSGNGEERITAANDSVHFLNESFSEKHKPTISIIDKNGLILFQDSDIWLHSLVSGMRPMTLHKPSQSSFGAKPYFIENGIAESWINVEDPSDPKAPAYIVVNSDITHELSDSLSFTFLFACLSLGAVGFINIILIFFIRRYVTNAEREQEAREELARDASQLRERLARQEIALRQKALEQSANAVIVFDFSFEEASITYANPACHGLLGWNPSTLCSNNYAWFLENIAVTSDRSEMKALEELDYAISNYLTKQVTLRARRADGTELWADIRVAPIVDDEKESHVVLVLNDITDTKRRQDNIERRSLFDPLTGLHTKFIFDDRLTQSIEQAIALNEYRALVCFDIDRFAAINETHGRRIGDSLLSLVGQRIREDLWPGDSAYRQGADEFWVLLSLPNDNEQSLLKRAQSIHQKLEERAYILNNETNDKGVKLRFSSGVCLIPKHASSLEDAFLAASSAAKHAKGLGGGRSMIWEHGISKSRKEKLIIEELLDDAIKREEFFLMWQPQFELTTGKIKGVEALIRWNSPTLGLVSPVKFIPVAEESGHIHELGRWLVRTVCQQAKIWQDRKYFITVAMNISARQFREPAFPDFLIETTKSSAADPNWLEMELTESDWMENPEEAIGLFSRLGILGTKMSIDDFGTGHSSLARVGDFPADALKIDRSFVQALGRDVTAKAIINAIVSLAKGLDMTIVAEGIEREEEIRYLHSCGVDLGQGFLLSKPLSTADFEAIMRSGGKIRPFWLD